jgi:short subunit dehydrogenase-like uncharacterized protein
LIGSRIENDKPIMSGRAEWMIYGANGYTGHLVAAAAKRHGLNPVLAGRRASPIEKLAGELDLPMRVFNLDDAPAAAAAIADMAVVANCAGPFAATSAPMIEACLTCRAHYLDITGEIDVFLAAQRRHADAQAAGIVICPGVGFDVIPTDCMAAVLKEALPDATQLALAFDAPGPMSPGTARTMVRSLRRGRHTGRVRRNGVIEDVPLAQSRRRIDFAGGSAIAIAIPWGDLATAWFSTGIPNIETYAIVPRVAAIASRALNWLRPLFASAPGQLLLQRLANRASGPTEEQLRTGRSRLWGEVRNAAGQRRTAQLETANGYRLTADGTIMAVQHLLTNAPSGGYYTPSLLLGARCVEQLPGSTAIRVA